jgi:hypothetical protein
MVGILAELDMLIRDMNEASGAGLASLRSGSGKLGSRPGGRSDPTTQAGYEFHRVQGALTFASKIVVRAEHDLEKVERSLERASSAILNAHLDTDPDLGPERREKRAAATGESQDRREL